MNHDHIHFLAISGSLRKDSSNAAILNCMKSLSSEKTDFTIYEGIKNLPHFNQDEDNENVDLNVKQFRSQLKQADGVILCTPEYAGGMPGVLKNALDWTVSSGEFYEKPVVVISASPLATGGEKAHASLLVTLSMLDAKVVDKGTLVIPFIYTKLDEHKKIIDPSTVNDLTQLLNQLYKEIVKS